MMYFLFFLGQCLACAGFQPQDHSMENHTIPSDSISYEVLHSFSELEAIIADAEEDEVLIINFWATWCAPCVKELPYFESFHKTYGSEKMRVLLVSLDFPKQIEKRFVPVVEKLKLSAELYILDDPNENDWIDKVDPSWSGTVPATLFIKGGSRKFIEKEVHSEEEILEFVTEIK